MSFIALSATEKLTIDPIQKYVLYALSSIADNEGICHDVTLKKIRAFTCLGYGEIQDAILELEKKGFLYWVKNNVSLSFLKLPETTPALFEPKQEKPKTSFLVDYYASALNIYNSIALGQSGNWTTHNGLSPRAQSQLKALLKHHKGDESEALNHLQYALLEMSTNEFYKQNKMSLDNLGSNSKFISEADKYKTKPVNQSKLASRAQQLRSVLNGN